MATIVKYKINGQETTAFREANDVAINAVFGEEVQADLSISEVNFVDSAEALNAKTVKELFLERPTEGHDFSWSVISGNLYKDFNFYMDYRTIKFLADNELSVSMIKDSSLNQFNDRAKGITMRLLQYEGIIGNADYQPFPYVVKNRKTELEKIQLLFQAFNIGRSISLEVRNIINIASDLPTLGGVVAGINLTVSLVAITQLFVKLVDLFFQIQESFFPIILYHAGIKPKTFLEKAIIDYMGYDGVEFGDYGTWPQIIEQETWCASKNQEKGLPFASLNFPLDGILKPSNEGYSLEGTKELLKEKYRLREAVIDNVYHLRPEKDPFWTSNSGYVMPNVLVEETLAGNGTFRPNYEDLNANTIIQYQTDDSDLHTLDDLIDSEDINSTGKIISVTTVTPINVNNQRKVLLNQGKPIDIPYALAVRDNGLDDLITIFVDTSQLLTNLKEAIEARLQQFGDILATSSPAMELFFSNIVSRAGACKVENHFFSIPKVALIADDNYGFPRIVQNFGDIIGAKALYNDFHSFDSFIEGKRNPDNLNETAAKYIYEDVRIPLGLEDYFTILNNPYFTTENGKSGKFLSLNWTVDKDEAVVSYWIYENWMSNIEENVE